MIGYNFLILIFCLLIGLKLQSENFADCPANSAQRFKNHASGSGWGNFHCDQIRQLRNRLKDLEDQITSMQIEIARGMTISSADRKIWEKLIELENTIQEQSQTIQLQQTEINNLENQW